MYYMIIKLLNTDYKEDIFLALQSIGISRASYTESHNLEHYLSTEMTLFKGFFKSDNLSDSEREEEAVITSMVQSKDLVMEFLKNLREADIDIDRKNILRIFLVPLSLVFETETGLKDLD